MIVGQRPLFATQNTIMHHYRVYARVVRRLSDTRRSKRFEGRGSSLHCGAKRCSHKELPLERF